MQAEAAKELVATMQRQGLNPDIYTYAPLVGALGGAGRVEEAMQVRMHACSTCVLQYCTFKQLQWMEHSKISSLLELSCTFLRWCRIVLEPEQQLTDSTRLCLGVLLNTIHRCRCGMTCVQQV